MVQTRQEIEHEKEEIHKNEVEKLKAQLKVATQKADEYAKMLDLKGMAGAGGRDFKLLHEVDGVKYSDAVSVFSVEPDAQEQEEELGPGGNILDLYIGKVSFFEEILPGVSDN